MSSNLQEPFSLKQTNAAAAAAFSRPKLSNVPSRQSIAASQHYYSLSGSDYAASSNGEDETSRLNPPPRFTTPPSRIHTPGDEQAPQSEATLQSSRPVRSRQQVEPVQPREAQLGRNPIGSSPTMEQKSLASHQRRAPNPKDGKLDPFSPSVSPGIDETPYIRFALDQLTRDEEVRGSRHYPGRSNDQEEEDDFQDAIAEASQPLSQSLRDEDEPSSSYFSSHVPTRKEKQKQDMARQKEMQAGTAPRHPAQDMSNSSQNSFLPQPYDVFVPYNPPNPTNSQPKLDFLPAILRPLWMSIYLFLCTLMLVGLIFSAIWSSSHRGLWNYSKLGDNRYFVFEYLPTLFGMLILIWLFQIRFAVQRISPYMAMASHSTRSRCEASFLDLYPTDFLLPKFQHFRAGQPTIGACFLVFWLFLFSVPLLASTFNVRYYAGISAWRWVAVQGVIWTLVALYIILIIALVVLSLKLWRTSTGLKWDPRSLADIIALLERSNIMSDYTGSETFKKMSQFKQLLWNRTDRLGYWHTSRRPQDIFYGLGEEGGATRRYSIEQGRIREKPTGPGHSQHSSISSTVSSIGDIENNGPDTAQSFNIRADIRSTAVRRGYMPWFLSSSAILAWIILAIMLLIAFYAVAFAKQALTRGFLPQLDAAADSEGFSPANFLYSFIPCLLGLIMYLIWLPLDFTHRRLAPFAAMSGLNGTTAEKSLLLDYPFALPIFVTASALSNRHYKVALLSAISTINMVIPVLAGGIFWAQWYPSAQKVRIAAQPTGLYAICFFLALYTIALFALVPGRKTIALPHDARSLSEIISWLYMSPLLCDRAFARCQTKAELVTKLVGVRPYHASQETKKNSIQSRIWESIRALAKPLDEADAARRAEEEAQYLDSDAGVGPSTAMIQPEKRLSGIPEGHSLPLKAATVLGEDFRNVNPRSEEEKAKDAAMAKRNQETRYGFGIFIGRDGQEHLGIERVDRGGREMVLFQDHNQGRKRTSWIGF
ncbi:putative alpha-1-6-mannosyltransferase [Venturia nashicola]|uniref:Putative alpha-1-6-mannosyltransferase n=1 Tax=Venturia nashicola TaxID=86259 RepID=A0A4Z1NML2_9PEZI|nr:putative alpha-1-6-mannosyltransferase [Venturia nashicola]